MLFTNIFALAFATLVAAETAEVQHEARDNYAATLYSQPNFHGASRRVDRGRCYDLGRPLRGDVQSIRVDRGDDCFLYEGERCNGRRTRYANSERRVRDRRVRSVRCVRDRRH
ncbi:hypothetical protein G6O67_005583 [Ophiocordyceps sinensis]|uniref:Beta/gamma crystallin 'Greek key' domain-containing protein n=2 Tax=Ophiocordyceps sinensis TaxID=72228 RepID=A0A8H4PRY0_9HYPO|nr:Beta/gamma crystallin [Ophiocordyceps sinensis CO18]KAF4509318.1 hypothetical protein G6O67_005583 [Ophiocordyceps sinensis]